MSLIMRVRKRQLVFGVKQAGLLEVEWFRESKNTFVLHVRVYQGGNMKPGTILDIDEPFCRFRLADEVTSKSIKTKLTRWNALYSI
jgi:hypothetical protein